MPQMTGVNCAKHQPAASAWAREEELTLRSGKWL